MFGCYFFLSLLITKLIIHVGSLPKPHESNSGCAIDNAAGRMNPLANPIKLNEPESSSPDFVLSHPFPAFGKTSELTPDNRKLPA